MKITHIGKYYYPVRGGIEKYIRDIVENIPLKQEIIVSNTKNKTIVENINNVKITRIAQQIKLFSTPINLTLIKDIKNLKSDILHLHLPNPMSTIAYLIAKPKSKLIITWHSDIIRPKLLKILFKPFQNLILSKANKIIVTSKKYLESSIDLKKYKNKCEIIPIGINLTNTKQNKNKIKLIKQKYKKPIVLFVGRLVKYKGIEYLIKATKDLEIDLIIIGNGPLLKKLKVLKNNNTHFLKEVDDTSSYYQACKMFVLPSIERTEAFGIVQLEAIKNKKPVISTKLNTGVEYVNKKGILIEPKNTIQLKKAIVYLLNNKNNNEIAIKSYDYIKKEFDIKKTLKKIQTLYHDIYRTNK